MKTFERITLIAVTTAFAGYIVRQAAHARSDRLCRLAAGESIYERTHPKVRRMTRPGAHKRSLISA
jgi:hypothetical protein